jgi:hypothetical protein
MDQSILTTSLRNDTQNFQLQTFYSRTNEKIMGVAFLMMAFLGEWFLCLAKSFGRLVQFLSWAAVLGCLGLHCSGLGYAGLLGIFRSC